MYEHTKQGIKLVYLSHVVLLP